MSEEKKNASHMMNEEVDNTSNPVALYTAMSVPENDESSKKKKKTYKEVLEDTQIELVAMNQNINIIYSRIDDIMLILSQMKAKIDGTADTSDDTLKTIETYTESIDNISSNMYQMTHALTTLAAKNDASVFKDIKKKKKDKKKGKKGKKAKMPKELKPFFENKSVNESSGGIYYPARLDSLTSKK